MPLTTLTASEYDYLISAATCASTCSLLAAGSGWSAEQQAIVPADENCW
jgi:hypothetical protein